MKIQHLFALILLAGSVAQADMGGHNYQIGSYSCQDRDRQLAAEFTFASRSKPMTMELTIKGKKTQLDCQTARDSSSFDVEIMKGNFQRATHFCTGASPKGRIIAAAINAMGIVRVKAKLVDEGYEILADTDLNCESVNAGPKSGW